MKKHLIASLLLAVPCLASAQTGADFMVAMKKADRTIPFDMTAKGDTFRVKWGMDTAWDWDYNVNRGINFIGKGNFETGRVSFQPIDLVTDNGDGTLTLSSRQQNRLRARINMIKTTGTNVVNLNCDHEVLFKLVDNRGYCQEADDPTGKNNYQGKPEEWYKLIKATTQYCQKQGLTVISVSPFNESDFVNWQQYKGNEANGMKDFLEIAKLIKQDPFFDNIRVCGGNTLNCDRALPWYNYLKEYLDEGNTHQLAGSFDTYANFFSTVKKDGKIGTADELHNVGEAIVGVQYGMENGIWWGFDSKARGQFCLDSNEGVRIGYGENRGAWTCAAVYRNDKTGEVHGYIGSSERQANSSSYSFVSTNKDVFINGYGPTRMWVRDIKGGTGYQQGQINAEYYFDVIPSGVDVPQCEVNDTFAIVNASTKNVLRWNGQNRVTPAAVSSDITAVAYLWHVYPSFTDGDCSYWFIDNITTSTSKVNLNVQNNNLRAGAGLICWDAGHNATEQWLLKYAGDGYYYIISRLSNMYLKDGGSAVTLENAPAADASATAKKPYLWRFQKKGTKTEFTKPKAPTDLVAKQRPGSIELSWTASTSNDIECYNVLRSEVIDGAEVEWGTIGRNIKGTVFTDNTASPDRTYAYKLVAVDKAGNRANATEPLQASCYSHPGLICQIQFDDSLKDATANRMDASLYGTEKYGTASKKSGTHALTLDGKTYLMLPYGLADQEEMTIAFWMYCNTTANWQRVFDWGNDTNHYMFYTPSNGAEQRFVMKNGDKEEILTNGKKISNNIWKHIAITIKPLDGGMNEASLYVDGELVATKSDFTISPSDIRPGLCFIGRSMFDSDPVFGGRLDDFRVYNYALSPEEVAAVKTDTEGLAEGYEDVFELNPDVAIHGVEASSSFSASETFDLQGRRVKSTTAPGIYIQNGKKILKK